MDSEDSQAPQEIVSDATLQEDRERLRKVLEASRLAAVQHLSRCEEQFQQFLVLGAEDVDLERNQKSRALLRRRIDDIDAETKKIRPNVVVPRNILTLQIVGDGDLVKNKTSFETVDKFLCMFEMILYQHDLILDDAWEQCMISAVQHSMDKSQWFQNNLMGKAMDWTQAKSMMRASNYDTPVNFVDRFETTLRSTGTLDGPGYGTVLLKALAGNHPTFVQQVRLAYAAAPRHLRPPMDVAYVASIAPILNMEPPRKESNAVKSPQKKFRGRPAKFTAKSIVRPIRLDISIE
ncbi:hypothetical protein [Absidia glauca]|uniref:Uncharacterized protein n=1 Tax=Absidia glauca TaxID=4829 RepID=A0A163K378_ABSGL|nr:hypothetical protein [Absidia glauca]